MTVGAGPKFDREMLATRAAVLQERYKFRFPLPDLLKPCSASQRAMCRMPNPMEEAKSGVLITDDFAPVNLYDTIGKPVPTSKPK
jgi:hypothetical protein